MSINLDISCNDVSNIVSQILSLLPKDTKGDVMVGDIPLTPPIFGKNVGLCKGENDKPLTSPMDSDIGQLLLPLIPQMVCSKSLGQCTGTGKCTDAGVGYPDCAKAYNQTKEACSAMQGKCIWKDCTTNTDETACQSPCKWTDSSCVKMASKAVDGVTDFLGKDQCGPAFCGDSSGNKLYTIPLGSCDKVKDSIRGLLSVIKAILSEHKDKIPAADVKYLSFLDMDTLCTGANLLTSQQLAAIPQRIGDYLAAALKISGNHPLIKSVTDLLEKLNITGVINCACPNTGGSIGQPIKPASQPPPPSYSMRAIGLLALALLALALLPIILVAVFVHPRRTKVISLVVTIAIFIAIFLALIFVNPMCILKSCPVSSDAWVGLTGTYEGKSAKIAGIQVSIKLDMTNTNSGNDSWKSQKVNILALACQDNDVGACPVKNLLSKCNAGDTSVTLAAKEAYGYPLVGNCINQMYKFTDSHGKQTIRGIWTVRKGSKVFAQILVHLPLGLAPKYINVELHKTS